MRVTHYVTGVIGAVNQLANSIRALAAAISELARVMRQQRR